MPQRINSIGGQFGSYRCGGRLDLFTNQGGMLIPLVLSLLHLFRLSQQAGRSKCRIFRLLEVLANRGISTFRVSGFKWSITANITFIASALVFRELFDNSNGTIVNKNGAITNLSVLAPKPLF